MSTAPVAKLLCPTRLAFLCPACGNRHQVVVHETFGWAWNDRLDTPTLTPSVLVKGTRPITDAEVERLFAGEEVPRVQTICHSYVTEGKIRFLEDCTHHLAGQIVDLPPWSDDDE